MSKRIQYAQSLPVLTANPPSETGRTVFYSLSDGLYARMGDGTIVGPLGASSIDPTAFVQASPTGTVRKVHYGAAPAAPAVGDLWVDEGESFAPTVPTFPAYHRAGHYTTGHMSGLGSTNISLTTGVAFARPYELWARQRFDRIGVHVSAAATGARLTMGLYRGGAGRPGAPLYTSEEFDGGVTGAKESVMNVTLDPGIYWVACLSRVAACSVVGINSGEHSSPYVAMSTAPLTTNAGYAGVTTASGQTALPTTAETPWTTATGNFPFVMLRAA